MTALVELVELTEQEKQRQEWLLTEQKQALFFLEIKAGADLLINAGISTSIRNIAEFTNMFDADVESAVNWFQKNSPGSLPFQLDATTEPRSELDQLIAGLSWISNRRLNNTKGRTTPPVDRSVLGMQKVMQLTGLGRVRILEMVQTDAEAIKKVFPEFRPAWVKDDSSIAEKNAKRQHPETKRELIREAILDIAKGRIGVVTGRMLEMWKGGAIGLNYRQIDRYLSERNDMRDLDKHRVVGKKYRASEEEIAQRHAANRS